MEGYLARPLTVRLQTEEDISTRDVIMALQTVVEEENIKCVTQTLRHGVWQISFGNQTAKHTVLRAVLDIKERHYECVELAGSRPKHAHPAGPPPALVTCKMPYEMPDATIKSVLSKHGHVSRVHRRCYSFAPMIETGVRVFTVVNPKGTFPISLQVGHYLIRFYVRYAGEPTRCYRCAEADHHVKDCPKPSSFRRCYHCNGTDHVYRNCKKYSTASTRATEQNRSEQSDTSVKETTPPLPCGYEGTLSNDKDDIQLSEWETNKTTSWCEAESNQGTASESDMKEGSQSDATIKEHAKEEGMKKEHSHQHLTRIHS